MLPESPDTGRKVLVVDDAPQNIKLLRVILKDAGYRVLEAGSGAEALAILQRERPDAMVLDVRMPGMTGYEVSESVRHDPAFAGLPIIMLTALSQPDERIRGIQAGATDFISKPFNKKELLARLQTSLALAHTNVRPIEQLPGAILFASPTWELLALSPEALLLLPPALTTTQEITFSQFLTQHNVSIAARASPWSFSIELQPGSQLHGRSTPVTSADDELVLWIVVFTQGQAPSAGTQ